MSSLYLTDMLGSGSIKDNHWPSGAHGQVRETDNWEQKKTKAPILSYK